ncbi:putative transcription factor OFP family [Rosa chinensis]|uniref:Transcription repressor n=1 Tax=Rosa chinensis TaxID=74649 RepID=A0A2P6PVX0_ROSCH|nr:transcription repressor OFP12 [Rosa chinensis]PRQ26083.1 putative transcription factor OFP family [Rosa chinensis]
MPSTLGRNLNLCFTKIKRPLLTLQSPPIDDHRSLPTTTSTATASGSGSTATSSSTLIKNFNSLYDGDHACFDSATTSCSIKSSDLSTSETENDTDTAADFATVFASQRFFFSSPGRSNSIVDQSSSSSTSSSSDLHAPFKHNSVAVPTYSPDPYLDFRRSMQEMVEAREHQTEDESVKIKSNWEFLHELLLCYLALNPKSTHKFIIGAFSDLLVSLLPSPKDPDFTAGVCEISRCS